MFYGTHHTSQVLMMSAPGVQRIDRSFLSKYIKEGSSHNSIAPAKHAWQ